MKWKSFRKRKVAATILPFPFYFTGYNHKNVGFDLKQAVYIIEDGWNHQLIEQSNYDEIGRYLLKKTKSDKTHLNKFLDNSKYISNNFLGFCRSKLNTLSSVDDSELILHLNTFFEYYSSFSNANIPSWVFLADKIHDELKLVDDFIILSTPIHKTYASDFEVLYLKLLLRIKLGNINLDKVFIENSNPDLFIEINNFINRYFWFFFDYIGPNILTIDKLFKMFKDNTLSIDQINNRIREADEHPHKTKTKQESLESKYDYETKHLFDCLKKIAILQDIKKEITTESHYYLQQLLKEISLRTHYNYIDLYYLLPFEIEESLINKKNYSDIINIRRGRSITLFDGTGEISILTGESADDFLAKNNLKWISEELLYETDFVSGQSASKGIVTGNVKVLFSVEDIHKIKKGDILVTTMTTPDYILAMRKAAAFITDEGGITCHAAIIAREMNKPCIIGTKNATKILKDGDLVEVDANTGIVKKL